MDLFYPVTFLWMERLIAIALILQTLEFFQIRKSFSSDGIWTWVLIRREFSGLPHFLLRIMDGLLSDRNFLVFLVFRTILSFAALYFHHPLIWGFLWLSTLLISVRWRGTFNGGSDYMTLIVLGAAFIGRAAGDLHYRWIGVALGYVGLQTCLSFFVAGVVKLRKEEWRSGKALAGFIESSHYGASPWLQSQFQAFSHPIQLKVLSWGIILFECTFPLGVLNPSVCRFMILGGLFFQLMNTYVLGLNRFFWAWAAAYPAFFWCAQQFVF